MITVLLGKNLYEIADNKSRLINDFVYKYGALGLEKFDSDSSPQLIYDALHNLPFLVESKLVILDQPSKNKELTEDLSVWLDGSHENINVLIIEPNPDKRTAWYKFISNKDNVITCDELDERSLAVWVKNIVEKRGGSIEDSAIYELFDRVGTNQQQLNNDLEKLLNFNKVITLKNVSLLVERIPQDSVFNLLESMMKGDRQNTMTYYENLKLSGVDENEILAMIGWQLHTIALVKSTLGKSSSESGLHPFVVQKNLAVAKKLSLKQISDLIKEVINTEMSIKKDGVTAQRAVPVLLQKILTTFN